MNAYGFIYLSTNTKNGMMYIGQTHYRARMDPNYFGSGKAIKRAIKRNGVEAFRRETLFEAFTKDDLDWAERHFIELHDAVKSRRFYNMTPGGRASLGFTGKKHTQQRNDALSQKMKGHQVTDRVRAACRAMGKQHAGALQLVRATCPHCGKEGQKGNMHRWHFLNCKLNGIHTC